MSSFGRWTWSEDGLPVFAHGAPPAASDRIVIGNRRITLMPDGYGTVSVADEHDGIRFLVAPASNGSGESLINGARPSVGERRFGPTWFEVDLAVDDVVLTRSFVIPEGEQPWVLVRVELSNRSSASRSFVHTERWELRPRHVTLAREPDAAARNAVEAISFRSEVAGARVVATECRGDVAAELAGRRRPAVFGEPHAVVLEALTGAGCARASDAAHPVLEVDSDVTVGAGECEVLWFRFGLDDGVPVDDPEAAVAGWRRALTDRLPRAAAAAAPMAEREVSWHAALLTGAACADGVLGGHTLDQASAYSYVMGFNGAARDPLQHAIPLVYVEPDLALSVLRNTCAWASPDGDLPYALDGAKRPWTSMWQPSDQNIWALWLASEYAAATGDLGAFAEPVGFHPAHGADQVPLQEHLQRQFSFLIDGVGLGEHGHLRIRNADWNDMVIGTSGVDHEVMVDKGESVLNSAMAAWVLPRYAGLCERLGDVATASAARSVADELRAAVAAEWNGRWFRRAYGPGVGPIGDDSLWLEVQPWAILCGAADGEQAAALLEAIDEGPRSGSLLGARVRWPVLPGGDGLGGPGDATNGGIWYSINATLVWAAASVDPELAWDEWRRMSFSAHAAAYPDVWEGTLSGPDSYNAPESDRPGRTWSGMQTFPVGNLHSHAQPLLAYLRLVGIEPAPDGALRIGGSAGARFESRVVTVEADGSGRLAAAGPVVVDTAGGRIEGGPGEVRW